MRKPTAVVSGMIAGTPRQGGATWAVLQYLLGLRRLGYDVLFVEPVGSQDLGGSESARYCREVMHRFGFDGRWALVQPGRLETVGLSRSELRAAAREANVLINVSGMLADADVLEQTATRVYLDLDPAFVQLWQEVENIDMRFDAHTHFVTIADTIGTTASPVPACGRTWIPTLPPVVLTEWPVGDRLEHDALTTVGHWRGYGSIEHNGLHYGQKVHALRPLIGLPLQTVETFRLALSIHPEEKSDLSALGENRWQLVDPAVVAATPDGYRRFVAGSKGEFGVAKSGYVVSNSGWFSDRSACYLASGRPVIAHDTGFGRRLPTGSGLFAFADTQDAAAAVDALHSDYGKHRAAARAIAEEHLDSDRVLRTLLDRVGA
jgi:hypothetical protein